MNLLQLAQRLKVESGRSGGGPVLTVAGLTGDDARLVYWLGSAWLELQNLTEWRWMRKSVTKAIVAGTSRYTVAGWTITDFRKWVPSDEDYKPSIYKASAPNHVGRLHEYRFDQFRRDFLDQPTQDGWPQFYAVDYNDDIVIGPTADDAYQARFDYWADVTPLAADADTPNMPARHHEILVWRALMELASFDAAPEVYTRGKANYDRMLDDLWAEQGPRIGLRGRSLT